MSALEYHNTKTARHNDKIVATCKSRSRSDIRSPVLLSYLAVLPTVLVFHRLYSSLRHADLANVTRGVEGLQLGCRDCILYVGPDSRFARDSELVLELRLTSSLVSYGVPLDMQLECSCWFLHVLSSGDSSVASVVDVGTTGILRWYKTKYLRRIHSLWMAMLSL